MNNKTCINCIHKDVCYMYRLNYIGAREGYCANYYEKPKKGKWVLNDTLFGSTSFRCSVCNDVADDVPTCMNKPLYKFCPNCGADMRGGQDNDPN